VAINGQNSRFICREYPERPGRITAPHIRRVLQRPLEPKGFQRHASDAVATLALVSRAAG
jgi:hypothetical protein